MHLIAKARIKSDVIDATVLASLYASGCLPEVWVPDQKTMSLRRQVTRRSQVVRQRVRLKTMIQAILHNPLVPQCPHADIAGRKGCALLLAQLLPDDEVAAIERHLREYDRLSEDLRVLERELARDALAGKIAVIVWHLLTRGQDYVRVHPALHATKLRDLELRCGQPARRGQRGAGYEYSLTKSRQEERQRGEQGEAAYKRLNEGWTKRGNRVPASASEKARK